ncbi:MAG TPA: Hsp20/alpha crystallin family protein [Syntrophorhabdales bacterium]|nr:Hsp20/alpha crystallin family protein [Syntrophorhabdales bacterium]
MLWTTGLGRFGGAPSPWTDLERMEKEMNRMLSRYAYPSSSEFPAFNIWGTPDQAVVTTEIPGIEPESIDIAVSGSTLTVRGSREPESAKEGESYHRRERWYGKFSKAIELPFTIEAGKVEARFAKGILTIRLPRSEAEKPRKITVKSA